MNDLLLVVDFFFLPLPFFVTDLLVSDETRGEDDGVGRDVICSGVGLCVGLSVGRFVGRLVGRSVERLVGRFVDSCFVFLTDLAIPPSLALFADLLPLVVGGVGGVGRDVICFVVGLDVRLEVGLLVGRLVGTLVDGCFVDLTDLAMPGTNIALAALLFFTGVDDDILADLLSRLFEISLNFDSPSLISILILM